MQNTGTTRAALSHAGWPDVDARDRPPPATAPLPSHRIDWIDSDGNHAGDRGADALRRVWTALGALMRHHRALATAVMATAISLPIGLAGAVVLVGGDPRSLNPGVTMIVAATGLWVGTCCLSYLDDCRSVLDDGESDSESNSESNA